MYEVIQHASTVTPRIDIELDTSSITDLESEVVQGLFYDNSGNLASGQHAAYPNWTEGNRTDIQEIQQITAIFGPHQALTDQFTEPNTTIDVGTELTTLDGELIDVSDSSAPSNAAVIAEVVDMHDAEEFIEIYRV